MTRTFLLSFANEDQTCLLIVETRSVDCSFRLDRQRANARHCQKSRKRFDTCDRIFRFNRIRILFDRINVLRFIKVIKSHLIVFRIQIRVRIDCNNIFLLFLFVVALFVARKRSVRVCIRINLAHIIYVDVDRIDSLICRVRFFICRVRMNRIRSARICIRSVRICIRCARICIRINHAHITFVDVDRTRSLICRVSINCIRTRRRVFRRD